MRPQTKSPTVLIIESDHSRAAHITTRLTEEGYEVVGHAADLEIAIELINEARPAFIVPDFNLRPPAAQRLARAILSSGAVLLCMDDLNETPRHPAPKRVCRPAPRRTRSYRTLALV